MRGKSMRGKSMRRLAALLVCGLLCKTGQASPCYTTPEAAARGGVEGLVPLGVTSGYRLESRRWDALLGRSWATVSFCGAPERPAITIATTAAIAGDGVAGERAVGSAGAAAGTGRPVVMAGEAVRVLYREARMQMELAGVAEGSGNVGDRIAVRMVRVSGEDGSRGTEQRLTATVKGPHALELVAATIGGRL